MNRLTALTGATFKTDAQGHELAMVPLYGRTGTRGQAVLDRVDYQRLMDAGFTGRWYLMNAINYGYVCAADKAYLGSNQPLARLIANAQRGEAVSYRDGNRLNLRRSNLILIHGPSAKGKTAVGANTSKAEAIYG